MQPESFSILTEFGVAIAGFSGVAAALSHGRGALDPMDRFRTLSLLLAALAAAFGSTFPLMAQSFGAVDAEVWRYAAVGILLLSVFNLLSPFYLRARLTDAEAANLSKFLWVFVTGGNAAFVLVQRANALSLIGPPSAGPIFANLIWMLFIASLLFVRLLVARPAASAEGRPSGREEEC